MNYLSTTSRTALLLGLASSSRIGLVPIKIMRKEPLAAAKDTL